MIKQSKRFFKINREGNLKKVDGISKTTKFKKKDFNYNYLNLGYYIITPIFLGALIGVGLDRWFGTKPFFTAIFISLGTIGTFYNLFKLARDEQRTTH